MVEAVETAETQEGPYAYENWRAALSSRPVKYSYECPLFTDAQVVGMALDGYGPYQLINTCADPTKRRSRPSIVLRVDYYSELASDRWERTSDDAYHGGGLDDEIAAIVSLCAGIRLKPGAISRRFEADDLRGYPICWSSQDDPSIPAIGRWPMIPGALGDHSLDAIAPLATLPELSAREASVLIKAARQYQHGLWIAESEPHLSWLMFVSAVETAAQQWRSAEDTNIERLRTSRPELEQLLLARGGEEFVSAVADLVAPYMGATKTFVSFLLAHLPEPVEPRPTEPFQVDWQPSTMKQSLQKLYGFRSRALHGGKPFPQPICDAPRQTETEACWERPPGLGAGAGKFRWVTEDLPMYLQTFEHICRGALLHWWRSLAAR